MLVYSKRDGSNAIPLGVNLHLFLYSVSFCSFLFQVVGASRLGTELELAALHILLLFV